MRRRLASGDVAAAKTEAAWLLQHPEIDALPDIRAVAERVVKIEEK